MQGPDPLPPRHCDPSDRTDLPTTPEIPKPPSCPAPGGRFLVLRIKSGYTPALLKTFPRISVEGPSVHWCGLLPPFRRNRKEPGPTGRVQGNIRSGEHPSERRFQGLVLRGISREPYRPGIRCPEQSFSASTVSVESWRFRPFRFVRATLSSNTVEQDCRATCSSG